MAMAETFGGECGGRLRALLMPGAMLAGIVFLAAAMADGSRSCSGTFLANAEAIPPVAAG